MEIPQRQTMYFGSEAIEQKLSSLLSENLIDVRQYGESLSILIALDCHVGRSKIEPGQLRTGSFVLPEKLEILTMELIQTELDGMKLILSGGAAESSSELALI